MDSKEYRRNYYLENKERELELMKIYRENNPEKIKDLRDKLKDSGYYREYYQENKSELIKYNRNYKKKIYEPYQKHAVYLLIDKELKAIYSGSTSNIYRRIEKHTGGWSHLKLDESRWTDLNCDHWEYCYVDGVTEKERLYIEKCLIEKFKPVLNKYEPIKNIDIDELRKAELEQYADGLVFKLWEK